MSQNLKPAIRDFAFSLINITLIFFAILALRYPILLNADSFLDGDEAHQAQSILSLLNGAPLFFYYETEKYAGILYGLTAIPFFEVLGTNALAYKMPPVLFYLSYVWTSYLIAKKFHPAIGYIVVFLMLFSPPAVTLISTKNWPHVLISFMGNIIFLLFIKAKSSNKNHLRTVFLLSATMGLAVYSYTYSLLHIFTIFLLYILSHPDWETMRSHVSFSAVSGIFKNLTTKREVVARFLDVVILFFFSAALFSYIFGGFGFDIAGVSIFQINNLHKPVFQILGLIAIRLLIFWKDLPVYFKKLKALVYAGDSKIKKMVAWGSLGFFIGISPRLASILTGETRRGGQGFDVDIFPVKLLQHFWSLMTTHLPEILGLREPLVNFFASDYKELFSPIDVVLLLLVSGLIILSAYSFFASNKKDVKRIITFRSLEFNPALIFLLLPILICAANIVVRLGPNARYLFPLYGGIVIWVAIYLNKIRQQSVIAFILLLGVWAGFYLQNNYRFYEDQAVIKNFSILKKREPLLNVIGFLNSKNIPAAYAGYIDASKTAFLSQGKLSVGEFTTSHRGKIQKARLAHIPKFGIVIQGEKVKGTYQEFLTKNQISYQEKKIGPYWVFWGFVGKTSEIDKLRSLITDY